MTTEFINTIETRLLGRGGRRTTNGGIEFRCFAPERHAHGDVTASAWWSPRKRCWSCRACGAKGGALDAAERLGVPRPPAQCETGRWSIRNAAGAVVAVHVRLEPGRHGKRKECVWQRPDGQKGLDVKTCDLPLYGIHEVGTASPGSTVVLVEGEKARDALTTRGIVAVGTVTGAGGTPSEAVLRELRGFDVVLWPDNDEDGRRHMTRIADRLWGLEVTPRWFIWNDAPAKGDAADWTGTTAALTTALATALPLRSAQGNGTPPPGRSAPVHDEPSTAPLEVFDEKGHFVPARLGMHLLTEAAIRLGHDRRLWRYVHGVYRPDADDWVKARSRVLLGEAFRRQHLEQVLAYLRADLPSLGHEPPVSVINCDNGLLDWSTGILHPHDPTVLSTNQLPVAWKPTARCPRTLQFFAETVPWDALELLEELLGYALYPGNPFRKAVLFFGAGGNGKSVTLGLFEGLLGTDNVAHSSLQALGENRFAAADLFGKLANICGDLDARAIEHTDLFKQATGGDMIRAEFKFRDAFSFRCYALPLFSANELPRTADQTNAWFDRWIIIPMRWRFAGAREDPGLGQTLTGEREGLLVRAVAGLRRLMARGRFVLPPSVLAAGTRYRNTLDTVRAFVAEQCHFDPDTRVDRAELYQDYRKWCLEGGRLPLANFTFNQHVVQAFGTRVFLRKHIGRPCWFGLGAGPGGETADAGPADATDDEIGDAGDAGDAAPDLSPHPALTRSQSQPNRGEGAEVESGERSGTASPTSPPSLREPGDDDPFLDLAESLGWPCIPLRQGLTILGTRLCWEEFAATAAPADRTDARGYLEQLGRQHVGRGEE